MRSLKQREDGHVDPPQCNNCIHVHTTLHKLVISMHSMAMRAHTVDPAPRTAAMLKVKVLQIQGLAKSATACFNPIH